MNAVNIPEVVLELESAEYHVGDTFHLKAHATIIGIATDLIDMTTMGHGAPKYSLGRVMVTLLLDDIEWADE